jgi:8-oxo-dGTP pyrophosphatase MutT (NUDIX family)
MADPSPAPAEWPDAAVSSREALDRGLPGWPAPGEEPPGPTAPVPPGRGGEQRIPRPFNARPGGQAPWADLPATRRRPSVADVRTALAEVGPAERSPHAPRDGAVVAPAVAPADAGFGRTSRFGRPSAVLAPLYDADAAGHVVLTRRTWGLRTHQGEVSFPGGRIEPGESPVDGARREAQEEIGLEPASIEIIGELDHLTTVSSGSFIVPYVGALPGRPHTARNPAEVDAVLHVPLAELLDPAIYRQEIWRFPGGYDHPVNFFELIGDTVWGATAALLRQLLGIVTGTLGRGDLDHP